MSLVDMDICNGTSTNLITFETGANGPGKDSGLQKFISEDCLQRFAPIVYYMSIVRRKQCSVK